MPISVPLLKERSSPLAGREFSGSLAKNRSPAGQPKILPACRARVLRLAGQEPQLRWPAKILPACRARVLRLAGQEPQLRWPAKILPACRARVLRLAGQERGRLGAPIVASKPNDLAGKRRGFRSHSTPRNGNKNGIKPIGLDKHKSNTPLPTRVAYQQTKSDSYCFAGP
jgi:hypothetical protein